MSTKFAQRPAPRKRPWICKRSPPCLIAPTFPPTLLCTFSLQKYWPLPVSDTYAGTFLLRWRPVLRFWMDSALDPPNGITAEYTYEPATGVCTAYAFWQVGPWIDDGWFDVFDAGIWPKMFYFSKNVQATTYYWNATLQITG